jgi:hypothetical protein
MQKKLKLDLDTLALDSFPTTVAADKALGTVLGQVTPCTFKISGCVPTYHTCASFDVSC